VGRGVKRKGERGGKWVFGQQGLPDSCGSRRRREESSRSFPFHRKTGIPVSLNPNLNESQCLVSPPRRSDSLFSSNRGRRHGDRAIPVVNRPAMNERKRQIR
jgi:hypothetical protein